VLQGLLLRERTQPGEIRGFFNFVLLMGWNVKKNALALRDIPGAFPGMI